MTQDGSVRFVSPPGHFSSLRLNPGLDPVALHDRFLQDGYVRIDGFLEGDAALALHSDMRAREDWVQVINGQTGVIELSRPVRQAMESAKKAALDDAVHAQARYGFQYRYETIRVPDTAQERIGSKDPLAAFAHWMSGGKVREFLQQVTGNDSILFADAQGTAYSPGDFLTGHDDGVKGKNRIAAYILGLSPVWRMEWGGMLMLHDRPEEGNAIGLVPRFNSLTLLKVPQMHSVSAVTHAAAYRRYSITGWLRTEY